MNRINNLGKILEQLSEFQFQIFGTSDIEISGATWDYKAIQPNDVYFCLEEEEFHEAHIHGNALNHVEDALDHGAVVLIAAVGKLNKVSRDVVKVEVNGDLNLFMAFFCRTFYGDPLANVKTIGVTGTKGKTTTCQLIDRIFQGSGQKTGYIGTLGTFTPSAVYPAGPLSNPLSSDLFASAEKMNEENVTALAMEVTSHGMHFRRNASIDFDAAVFTNFSLDHLDFHKTLDNYKSEKMRFFSELGRNKPTVNAIVNIDDSIGAEFIKALESKHVKLLTYGITNKEADLVAYPKTISGDGSTFSIFYRGKLLGDANIQLPGLFNVYNALAAFTTAYALGIPEDAIISGLESVGFVKGRFEKVDNPTDINVLIDYAHTPDALKNSLESAKAITQNRLICVFGCGGDRDRGKRPLMGSLSAELADETWITSDNPRTEEPICIIEEVLAGVSESLRPNVFVCERREEAICNALSSAKSGDTVLIAGKGHEQYQIINKKKIHFSDREQVEKFFTGKTETVSTIHPALEISLSELRRNFGLIIRDMPDGLDFMAVVKDNALGVGILEMAETAISFGARYIGTANMKEALTVRNKFPDTPILVLGERYEQELQECLEKNITIQIQSLSRLRQLDALAQSMNTRMKVHVKIDTGMNRYGIKPEEVKEFFLEAAKVEHVHIEGVMTHFAQSDESDKTYAKKQILSFNQALNFIREVTVVPEFIHACNTGGYLDLPDAHFNMVRLGVLPTGVYPSKVCRRIDTHGEQLRSVMSVRASIAFTKALKKGESVGYGMKFTAEQDMITAIIPVGYSFGYPRMRNTGKVLINGQAAPIIGGISLDAIIVDVSHCPDVQAGTRVTLLGKDGEEEITVMEMSDWAGTVCYEIMIKFNDRFEKIYHV